MFPCQATWQRVYELKVYESVATSVVVSQSCWEWREGEKGIKGERGRGRGEGEIERERGDRKREEVCRDRGSDKIKVV